MYIFSNLYKISIKHQLSISAYIIFSVRTELLLYRMNEFNLLNVFLAHFYAIHAQCTFVKTNVRLDIIFSRIV